MPRALVQPTITVEFDTFGSSSDPALLLIMGFTAQMTMWDERFCRQLAEHGLFVIRFDNRDCGLSTKFDGQTVDIGAVMMAALSEQPVPPVPYTLSDMAADAAGVLDALNIERAHIIGASMGGMIAQTFAIEHPHRTISLTSIMSTVGDLAYGTPTDEALAALLAPPSPDRAALRAVRHTSMSCRIPKAMRITPEAINHGRMDSLT